MKGSILLSIALAGALASCVTGGRHDKPQFSRIIDHKVDQIDGNHRVRIVEDVFHRADTMYRIRGYFNGDILQKIIGISSTSHYERDDYFYFENNTPIFSGHMINFKDERLAEEFKYYYHNGAIELALFWKDHYQPGKRFPHEHFKIFEPNQDSLMATEKRRIALFLDLLNLEGYEIKHLNEQLGANRAN
jgi:hypothetical protein